MQENAFAVIMAGGSGERFWPLSTSKRPKQMLSLVGGKSLIGMAFERLDGLVPPDRVIIVTSADLVEATRAAVPSLPAGNVIGEPFGRDTAAAVALASAVVKKRAENGVFCILTADHVIGDIDVFQETIRRCYEIAQAQDVLITIGIVAAFPNTGFGYIETAEQVHPKHGGRAGTPEFVKVRRFVEKPDRPTAEKYVASGKYFWNSGMFIWSVAAIQKALSAHCPQLHEMAQRIEPLIGTAKFSEKLTEEYSRLEKISVDYAVMEKAGNILMARGTFYWDDVGSWKALENHFDKDANGNTKLGQCEVVDSTGNIVVSQERLTALVGVNDLVVVQAENATLVCAKEKAEDVRKIVKLLKEGGAYDNLL